jgi:hypothetical protein
MFIFMASLANVEDQFVAIDLETRNAFSFIETGRNPSFKCLTNATWTRFFSFQCNLVVRIHTQFVFWCRQPIKNAIIRMFPYVHI